MQWDHGGDILPYPTGVLNRFYIALDPTAAAAAAAQDVPNESLSLSLIEEESSEAPSALARRLFLRGKKHFALFGNRGGGCLVKTRYHSVYLRIYASLASPSHTGSACVARSDSESDIIQRQIGVYSFSEAVLGLSQSLGELKQVNFFEDAIKYVCMPDYLAIQEDHLEELVDLEDLEDLEDLGVGDTELFSLFSRSFANERCVRSLNCVIALRAASSLPYPHQNSPCIQ